MMVVLAATLLPRSPNLTAFPRLRQVTDRWSLRILVPRIEARAQPASRPSGTLHLIVRAPLRWIRVVRQ